MSLGAHICGVSDSILFNAALVLKKIMSNVDVNFFVRINLMLILNNGEIIIHYI